MWTCTLVLVAVCVLAAEGSGLPSRLSPRPWNVTSDRIYGGKPVNISQCPWMASVMWDGKHICGASIISRKWVLTAAHCIDYGSARRYRVRVGTSDLNRGGTVHAVSAVLVHGAYDPITIDYDIGALKLRGRISISDNVQIVNLGRYEPIAGTSVTVTGWGYTEANELSETLLAVTVQIVERSVCNAAYEGCITERMICAGVPEGGKDSCQGDSGGPLVAGNTQYGVVSWGAGCGEPGYPGVYASVPALRTWIRAKTGV